jgi:hypothetical protein
MRFGFHGGEMRTEHPRSHSRIASAKKQKRIESEETDRACQPILGTFKYTQKDSNNLSIPRENKHFSSSSGAESGAVHNVDPELHQIVTAWPTLPEPIRRAVLAMIEVSGCR